jgi:hypothetical protein
MEQQLWKPSEDELDAVPVCVMEIKELPGDPVDGQPRYLGKIMKPMINNDAKHLKLFGMQTVAAITCKDFYTLVGHMFMAKGYLLDGGRKAESLQESEPKAQDQSERPVAEYDLLRDVKNERSEGGWSFSAKAEAEFHEKSQTHNVILKLYRLRKDQNYKRELTYIVDWEKTKSFYKAGVGADGLTYYLIFPEDMVNAGVQGVTRCA